MLTKDLEVVGEQLIKLLCNHKIDKKYHSLADRVVGRFYCMQCEEIITPENNNV